MKPQNCRAGCQSCSVAWRSTRVGGERRFSSRITTFLILSLNMQTLPPSPHHLTAFLIGLLIKKHFLCQIKTQCFGLARPLKFSMTSWLAQSSTSQWQPAIPTPLRLLSPSPTFLPLASPLFSPSRQKTIIRN